MQNDSVKSFKYSFVNDSSNSYLVLDYNSDIKLLNHQVEIISQNPSSAFVPFHMRREDENVSIYYNITSKISLSQYLERKRLNKKELLDLLRSITKGLMLHSNYLLDFSSFVLDKDFIYINPATADASLVYVPIASDIDPVAAYKFFLKDLIVNSATVDDNAKDNYLQRILNYLKSEVFGLNDFNRLIADLRSSGELNDLMNKSINIYRERTAYEEVAAAGYAPGSGSPANSGTVRTMENIHTLGIVLFQLLLVLAVVIVSLVLTSQGMGDLISISGVLIIAAALDMLIVKRMAAKQGKRSSVIADCNDTIRKPQHNAYRGKRQPGAKAPDILRASDTIIVSEVEGWEHPYLERVGVNSGERIVIDKDKFVIGRLGSMVDYVVQSSTVGKLHAEITVNGGIYSIKDLNSKNGTYLNEVRIPSNMECEIKSSDRVRFSNFDYIFRQEKVL